jgi:hypothetical protein
MKRSAKDMQRVIVEFQECAHQLQGKRDDHPEDFSMPPRLIGNQWNWVCSEKFCGFWDMCPRGGGDYTIPE